MGCTVTVANKTESFLTQKSNSNLNNTRDDNADIDKCNDDVSEHMQRRKELLCLNERQKFLIIKSWKGISRNIRDTGVNMFTRMFETNLDIRGYFTDIKPDSTISDIRENNKFESHAITVMHTIDDAITSFDDVTSTIDLLLNVGKFHRRFITFKAEDFWKIEEPFLMAVKETLGDRYTANMECIYKKAINFILSMLVEGFNQNND